MMHVSLWGADTVAVAYLPPGAGGRSWREEQGETAAGLGAEMAHVLYRRDSAAPAVCMPVRPAQTRDYMGKLHKKHK